MPSGYGQYCPLALAAEIVSERWSLLVVSRLIDGCRRFNEIQRGLPRISATMLSQRLQTLEDAGLLQREVLAGGRGHEYHLTEAGRELEPVIDQLAGWGQRWARDMDSDDLDVRFLAWSVHTRIDAEAMPDGRTVLEFEFFGVPDDCRYFWLVNDHGKIDMCLKHPGFEIDLQIQSDLRRFVETWRGFRSLREELRIGKIRLRGPKHLVRSFPSWLLLSSLAHVERQRPGPERSALRRRRARSRSR